MVEIKPNEEKYISNANSMFAMGHPGMQFLDVCEKLVEKTTLSHLSIKDQTIFLKGIEHMVWHYKNWKKDKNYYN